MILMSEAQFRAIADAPLLPPLGTMSVNEWVVRVLHHANQTANLPQFGQLEKACYGNSLVMAPNVSHRFDCHLLRHFHPEFLLDDTMQIRTLEILTDGSHIVTIEPAIATTGNHRYILPVEPPSEDSYLVCDAGGHLRWEATTPPAPLYTPNVQWDFNIEDITATSWGDRSGSGITLTPGGTASFGMLNGGARFHKNQWAQFSTTPTIKAFIARVQMLSIVNSVTKNYFVLTHSSTYDNSPGGTGSTSAFADTNFAQVSWKTADVYSDAIASLGKTVDVTYAESGCWQNWATIYIEATDPTVTQLMRYDRLGRDRFYHEASCTIKAIAGFANPLSVAEREQWFNYYNAIA